MRRARAKETLTETVLMSELYSPPSHLWDRPGLDGLSDPSADTPV